MLRRHRASLLLAALLLLVVGRSPARAEALFAVSDDGATFLYRARPGDKPGTVAEMFGLSPRDVPAFLAANGITDATRVGPGFVYRIPNVPARALAERAATLQSENARLNRRVADSDARTHTLGTEAEDARAAAAQAESHAARAAWLQRLWPLAELVMALLVIATGGAFGVAVTAVRRQRRAEHYARSLVLELDDKRKAGLLERQESARRILELETRLRNVEAQLGPRRLMGGRT